MNESLKPQWPPWPPDLIHFFPEVLAINFSTVFFFFFFSLGGPRPQGECFTEICSSFVDQALGAQ